MVQRVYVSLFWKGLSANSLSSQWSVGGSTTEEKSRHTFHIYYFVGITVLILVFPVEVIASAYIDIHDLVLSLTALALGATLAAYLTTATYDHISRSTQEREWKREIQIANWEDIYLPIYKDLVSSQSALESYHYIIQGEIWHSPDLPWKETILEIINLAYLKKVRRHIELHHRYTQGLTNLKDVVTNLARVHHENLFPQEEVGNLNSIFIRHSLYAAGIAKIIPNDEMTGYVSLYNTIKAKYPNVTIDPMSSIQILRSKVQGQPEVEELRSAHTELSKSTKVLIEATKEVIQKPYQI